jgi:hypothetical protein
LLSGTWDKRAAALAAEESVAVAAAVSVSVSVSGGDDVGERISRPGLKREVEAEGGRAKRTKVAGSREGTDSIAETEMAEAKVDTEPEPKKKASELDDIFASKPKKDGKVADKKQKKKKADGPDDGLSKAPKAPTSKVAKGDGEVKSSGSKVEKKKKKGKKDAMDDIFGF